MLYLKQFKLEFSEFFTHFSSDPRCESPSSRFPNSSLWAAPTSSNDFGCCWIGERERERSEDQVDEFGVNILPDSKIQSVGRCTQDAHFFWHWPEATDSLGMDFSSYTTDTNDIWTLDCFWNWRAKGTIETKGEDEKWSAVWVKRVSPSYGMKVQRKRGREKDHGWKRKRNGREMEEKWKRGQVVTSYPLLSFRPNPHQLGSTTQRVDRKGSMMRRGERGWAKYSFEKRDIIFCYHHLSQRTFHFKLLKIIN